MNNPLPRSRRSWSIESAPNSNGDRRSVATILWHLISTIDIKPLSPPVVPQNQPDVSPLLRIHHRVRLFLLDIEYALSPDGHLRGLMKFLLRLVVIANAFSFTLAAILMGVSIVTAVGAIISGHLATIAMNCFLALLAILGCILVMIFILRVLSSSARRN